MASVTRGPTGGRLFVRSDISVEQLDRTQQHRLLIVASPLAEALQCLAVGFFGWCCLLYDIS